AAQFPGRPALGRHGFRMASLSHASSEPDASGSSHLPAEYRTGHLIRGAECLDQWVSCGQMRRCRVWGMVRRLLSALRSVYRFLERLYRWRSRVSDADRFYPALFDVVF